MISLGRFILGIEIEPAEVGIGLCKLSTIVARKLVSRSYLGTSSLFTPFSLVSL